MFKIADGIRFLKEYPNLTSSSDTALQVNSTHGYIRIGAGNASYGHILTDRSQFYFNKQLTVDTGIIQSYDDDLILSRTSSSTTRIVISSSRTASNQPLTILGGSSAWNTSTQGTSGGSLHLDPEDTTDDYGSAITFGASDNGTGDNAQAGIYVRSDGNYGTKMYLSTTDSYAQGSKTAISIDHLGHVTVPRGSFVVSGGVSIFSASGLDPDSYVNFAGGFGSIADGSGWSARGLFISGAATGRATAIASGSGNVYFGTQDGSNANSMASWLTVRQSTKVANFAVTPTSANNTIWHAGNDGSGSGLDADTVDGVHASGFATSTHDHTILKTSGNYQWTESTTAGNYPTVNGSPGIQTSFVRSANGWPDYGAVLHVGARGGADAGGDFQLFCGHGSSNGGNYLRVRNADNSASPTDSWTSWRTIWDSGNDGPGSGLDADTVDGIQGDTIARVYKASINVTLNSYNRIARVSGNNLASSVRMVLTGTTGNVVVNSVVDILANHSTRIQVHSQTGRYTDYYLKIISNDNESFDIYFKHVSGGTTLPLYIEIFPLSSETVEFSPTAAAYTGATYEKRSGAGQVTYSSGGGSAVNLVVDGGINPGGTTLIGSSTAQSISDALQISSGSVDFTDADSVRAFRWYNGTTFRGGIGTGGWTGEGSVNSIGLYASGGDVTVHNNSGTPTLRVSDEGHLGLERSDASSGITKGYPKIVYPNCHWSATGTSTGQVKIKTPGTLSNYDMLHMELTVYEYNSMNATTIIIGGHNWTSSANANNAGWHSYGVKVIGTFNKPIRLTQDASGRYITLGDTNSTWSYGIVSVARVMGSKYYSTQIDWVGDWAISQVTSTSYTWTSPDLNTTTSVTLGTRGAMSLGEGMQIGRGNNLNNFKVKTNASGAAGISLYNSSDQWRAQLYGEGSNYGFLDDNWGGWDIRKTTNGAMYFNGDNTYYLQPEGTSYLATLEAKNRIDIQSTNNGENHALLNIGYVDGGQTRAIDIDGGWSAGESKAISFTHGSGSSQLVGQWDVQHNSPGSRMRWGKLYHSTDSGTYTMQLISESTTGAYLTVTNSVRSKKFIDNDDTAYSVDPASSSRVAHIEGHLDYTFRGYSHAVNDWLVSGMSTGPTLNSQADYSWYINTTTNGWSKGLLSKARFRRANGLTLEYEGYMDQPGDGNVHFMIGFIAGDSTNYSYSQTPANLIYHDYNSLSTYTNGAGTGSDYSFDTRGAWWRFKTVLKGKGAKHYVYRNNTWNLIKFAETNIDEYVRVLVSSYRNRMHFRNMRVYYSPDEPSVINIFNSAGTVVNTVHSS